MCCWVLKLVRPLQRKCPTHYTIFSVPHKLLMNRIGKNRIPASKYSYYL